jgi:hypothetical protein
LILNRLAHQHKGKRKMRKNVHGASFDGAAYTQLPVQARAPGATAALLQSVQKDPMKPHCPGQLCVG